MLMNSPIPRARQPGFHQGSDLRSVRDEDATDQLWKKTGGISGQVFALARSVVKISRDLSRLRRRVLGGGTQQAGNGIYCPGEWDPTLSYPDPAKGSQAMVIFTPDGQAAGTYITAPGVTVPPGISPDTGAPNWLALPNAGPMQWT